MSRTRTIDYAWLKHLRTTLRANLGDELTVIQNTEITTLGTPDVLLVAPQDSALDFGHLPPTGRGVKYPALWIDNVRQVFGSDVGSGRGALAVDALLKVTLFLYFGFPGGTAPTRTQPQLVMGGIAYAEGVRSCVERYATSATVGAVTVTRIEDRTADLGADDQGQPYVSWIRMYEIDVEARYVARQSRGL